MGDAEALDSLVHQIKSKMAFRYDVMKLEDDEDDPDDMLGDAHSTRWSDHKSVVSSRPSGGFSMSSKMSSKSPPAANEKSVKAMQRRESTKVAARDALGVSALRKSMSEYGVEERWVFE